MASSVGTVVAVLVVAFPEVAVPIHAVPDQLGNISTAVCCFTDASTPNCLVGAGLGAIGLAGAGSVVKHLPYGVQAVGYLLNAVGVNNSLMDFNPVRSEWFSTPLFQEGHGQ
jgi:flagellar basal body P-ring protein FlgI